MSNAGGGIYIDAFTQRVGDPEFRGWTAIRVVCAGALAKPLKHDWVQVAFERDGQKGHGPQNFWRSRRLALLFIRHEAYLCFKCLNLVYISFQFVRL